MKTNNLNSRQLLLFLLSLIMLPAFGMQTEMTIMPADAATETKVAAARAGDASQELLINNKSCCLHMKTKAKKKIARNAFAIKAVTASAAILALSGYALYVGIRANTPHYVPPQLCVARNVTVDSAWSASLVIGDTCVDGTDFGCATGRPSSELYQRLNATYAGIVDPTVPVKACIDLFPGQENCSTDTTGMFADLKNWVSKYCSKFFVRL